MGEYVVCWDSLMRWVSGYGRVYAVLGLFDEMGEWVWASMWCVGTL